MMRLLFVVDDCCIRSMLRLRTPLRISTKKQFIADAWYHNETATCVHCIHGSHACPFIKDIAVYGGKEE